MCEGERGGECEGGECVRVRGEVSVREVSV